MGLIEKGEPEPESTVLLAFPDVGLVGPIAVKHLVRVLDMEEIGHITSDGFPPVTVVHGYRPTHPIRIYQYDNIVVITSEIPVGPNLIGPFSKALTEWLEDINAGKTIILGGLPHQNRDEVEEPEIHGVASNQEMQDHLEDHNFHVLEEGFITGINGVLLRNFTENELSSIYLMAEAHRSYPDPGAAASILEALNDLENIKVDVQELRKKEEEIKVAARDLMRQTQQTMQKTSKNQEEELPIMYG